MKEIIYNDDNLLESDITEVVVRTKALIINDNNIYLGYADNIYQFPGGHLEANETINECLRREVMEEVGIKVKNITYYKNQPWSFTDTLLVGFYC